VSYWRWSQGREGGVDATAPASAAVPVSQDTPTSPDALTIVVRGRAAWLDDRRMSEQELTAALRRRVSADPRLVVVVVGEEAEPGVVDEFADVARFAGVTHVSAR
jgi:hypothetical protein